MRFSRRALVCILVAFPCIALALSSCSKAKDPWPDKTGPKVLTSFAPIYCFTKNVAGDDASVLYVMSETGPHEFNPTAEDAAALARADLFIINGLGLDDGIAKRLVTASSNRKIKIIETGEAIPESDLREGAGNDEHDKDKKAEKKEADSDEKFDPHVWLGIPEAIKMVERIRDALKAEDPAHAAGYDSRAGKYIERLNSLLTEGRQMLASKKNPKVLAFHDALFYFARAFKLEIVGSIELAPGVEPSASEISRLLKVCKEQNVIAIAVEPQYDTNTSAKVIQRDLNSKGVPANLVVIDPMETAMASELTGEFYEKKMRENLQNLAEKLK
jgi:ABC-type Zn uptake system ZnuABC Zn-binding protein ZnuA